MISYETAARATEAVEILTKLRPPCPVSNLVELFWQSRREARLLAEALDTIEHINSSDLTTFDARTKTLAAIASYRKAVGINMEDKASVDA